MRTKTLLFTTLLTIACTADGDSGSESADSTSEATTAGDPTTSGTAGPTTDSATTTTVGTDEPTTSDASTSEGSEGTTEGTTGDAPLTPEALVGTFTSPSCEAYPDGNGGTNYLTRSFTLTTETWNLELDLFMDAECAVPLFSAVIDGPYELGGLAAVDGATEGQFGLVTNVWTAHQQFMADLFTDSACGDAPWEVGVPQDVATTGCIGVAHPIDECPQEYDIVALDGDALYFGERVTDLCVPEGRPAALVAYAVIRR